jgi:outer membrane protein OmpA-like peptidoglycan-associated protein
MLHLPRNGRCSWLVAIAATLLMIVQARVLVAQDVLTGPTGFDPSTLPSAYLRGVTTDTTMRPHAVRVLGTQRDGEALRVRMIVLDSLGNLLPAGLMNLAITADVRCADAAPTRTMASSRFDVRQGARGTTIIVCDNSLLSGSTSREVVRSLRDVLPTFPARDSVGIVVFDHDVLELAPLGPTSSVADACVPEAVPEPDGLCASFAATLTGLAMAAEHDGPRTVVLVVASDDNASFSTTTEQIVRRARELDAVVHVLRLGTQSRAFPYRYIASATGGRLTTLPVESAGDVGAHIRELVLGSTSFLDVSFSLTGITSETCGASAWLMCNVEDLAAATPLRSDSISLQFVEQAYRTSPAIVATFADTTEVGLQNFYPLLASMAEELMSDSTLRVELIGHVSDDVTSNADVRARERAGYVRDFLKAYGVRNEQLSVRSDGSRRPLYYFQLDGTQRLMNNRVEARLLTPDAFPYTITVDQVETEAMAYDEVRRWEQRNFKAYFELVVANHAPVYRVKLWGYRTLDEARKGAASAKKQKAKSTIIE